MTTAKAVDYFRTLYRRVQHARAFRDALAAKARRAHAPADHWTEETPRSPRGNSSGRTRH